MRIYQHIAAFFTYPTVEYQSIVDKLLAELQEYGTATVNEFMPVASHFNQKPIAELQEYYIQTFDVNASCYLDLGYVLFGEESKRAQFLLHMKSEQLKANNDCGTEFPDHLPNVLTLLPKIEDAEFREELVVTMVLPALRHMLGNFRTEGNIYRNLLKILIDLLENDFKDSAFEPYTINQKEIENAGVYSCGMDFTMLKSQKY